MPWNTAITAFSVRRFSANGSMASAGGPTRLALGPKNFGMSRPAVVCSPAAHRTATHSSSSRSKAVSASLSATIISGTKAFVLRALSTTIFGTRASRRAPL
jgi:hypothetical protein